MQVTTKKYNEDWIEYYQYLETLRQSGITNMYGAATYLEEAYDLDRREGSPILLSWIQNYDALVKDGVIDRKLTNTNQQQER